MAMIAFKEPQLIHHWPKMHGRVIEVVEWIAWEVWDAILGQPFLVITAGWYEGGSGVHALYRAVDVSVRDYVTKDMLPMHDRTRAARVINDAWDYGKVNPGTGRPYLVCYHHKVDGSAWHFHIQVRNETRLRGS